MISHCESSSWAAECLCERRGTCHRFLWFLGGLGVFSIFFCSAFSLPCELMLLCPIVVLLPKSVERTLTLLMCTPSNLNDVFTARYELHSLVFASVRILYRNLSWTTLSPSRYELVTRTHNRWLHCFFRFIIFITSQQEVKFCEISTISTFLVINSEL